MSSRPLPLGLSSLAQAGIISQLDHASQAGAPGYTLIFNVTLANPSAASQIWLNAISSTSVSPLLAIDSSPFNTNAPLFLDPLANSGPFELFRVIIDPSAPGGAYIGNIVSILGGADGGTGSAFDDLADISFDVQVQSTTSTAPGTGNFWLSLLDRVDRRDRNHLAATPAPGTGHRRIGPFQPFVEPPSSGIGASAIFFAGRSSNRLAPRHAARTPRQSAHPAAASTTRPISIAVPPAAKIPKTSNIKAANKTTSRLGWRSMVRRYTPMAASFPSVAQTKHQAAVPSASFGDR